MRIKFIFCWILLCFQILAFGKTGFARDEIIAVVNEEIITKSDMDAFINFMRIQLSSEYNKTEAQNKIEAMKSDLLDKLIEDRLILQEAKRAKISIDPSRIKAKIDEIKKNYETDKDFQDALFVDGLVMADLESKIKDQFLMQSIIAEEIKNKINISPSEITLFYEQSTSMFKTPAVRYFTYLTFDDSNYAQDIYNLLNKGKGMDELAEKYSLNTNKATFKEGEQLKPEIDSAISKLGEGEVTIPFLAEGKTYIFKLDRITLPNQKSLSDAQNGIYAYLFEKKMQEGLLTWLETLKKKSYIKIMQN